MIQASKHLIFVKTKSETSQQEPQLPSSTPSFQESAITNYKIFIIKYQTNNPLNAYGKHKDYDH